MDQIFTMSSLVKRIRCMVYVSVWGRALLFFTSYIQLSITTKFHVAIQLCQAVTFLHTNSPPLAHLDIKPSNILVRFKQHNISVLSRVLYKYMYVCIICRLNQRRGNFFLGILVSARLCQELMSLEQKRC